MGDRTPMDRGHPSAFADASIPVSVTTVTATSTAAVELAQTATAAHAAKAAGRHPRRLVDPGGSARR
jgi:hypothetical protein